MTTGEGSQSFLCLSVPPPKMDQLWADGWRHFGILFFQNQASLHGESRFSVMPLRIDLEQFSLTRSQKRVLKSNRDAKIVIRPSSIDEKKKKLFVKHRLRFTENIPRSLHDFMSPAPDTVPCANLELVVYLRKKLVGVTFLDLGETATSAVYAIFDPAESKRSLGILMMLESIRFSRERGYRYYYPGYAYRESSPYDYKKRFRGLEFLEWDDGWKRYVSGQDSHLRAAG